MNVETLMTTEPACCTPGDTVQAAARLMAENDCGCVPVVADRDSHRLVGVITDRDIAVRCVAGGKSPQTPVEEIMSADIVSCAPGDDVREVEKVMAERRLRRIPLVDSAGSCVGIVAQADLALNGEVSARDLGRLVGKISRPNASSPA